MSTCAVNALKIAEARAIIILSWGSLSPSLMGSHPWLGDRLRFENRPSLQLYLGTYALVISSGISTLLK